MQSTLVKDSLSLLFYKLHTFIIFHTVISSQSVEDVFHVQHELQTKSLTRQYSQIMKP